MSLGFFALVTLKPSTRMPRWTAKLVVSGRDFQPPREPLKIAAPVFTFQRRLEVDVAAARVNLQLDVLIERFQRFVENPCLTYRNAIIRVAMLNQYWGGD